MFLSLWFAFHTEIGIRGCYQVPEFPESGYGQNISRRLKRKICQGEMRSEITRVMEQANGTKEMVNGHHVLGGRGVSLVDVVVLCWVLPTLGYGEG